MITREEFKRQIKKWRIPDEKYNLEENGFQDERYNLAHNTNGTYEIYYKEHGEKTRQKSFYTESEALLFLLECLLPSKALEHGIR